MEGVAGAQVCASVRFAQSMWRAGGPGGWRAPSKAAARALATTTQGLLFASTKMKCRAKKVRGHVFRANRVRMRSRRAGRRGVGESLVSPVSRCESCVWRRRRRRQHGAPPEGGRRLRPRAGRGRRARAVAASGGCTEVAGRRPQAGKGERRARSRLVGGRRPQRGGRPAAKASASPRPPRPVARRFVGDAPHPSPRPRRRVRRRWFMRESAPSAGSKEERFRRPASRLSAHPFVPAAVVDGAAPKKTSKEAAAARRARGRRQGGRSFPSARESNVGQKGEAGNLSRGAVSSSGREEEGEAGGGGGG